VTRTLATTKPRLSRAEIGRGVSKVGIAVCSCCLVDGVLGEVNAPSR
jgi:hypothetical protein